MELLNNKYNEIKKLILENLNKNEIANSFNLYLFFLKCYEFIKTKYKKLVGGKKFLENIIKFFIIFVIIILFECSVKLFGFEKILILTCALTLIIFWSIAINYNKIWLTKKGEIERERIKVLKKELEKRKELTEREELFLIWLK